ncbi:MAG: hypothetical protein C0497_00395 [Gemmatimonas sp.]|nr:hypothetical protein [Gemmatimonas sp.]
MTYSLEDYVAMIADPHRTEPYVRAMRRLVAPDSVVLDLGAGFGYFAVLAATLGARHVYAIETNDAVALGPALARANGVADRITFFHGDSRRVELPERATVLVEDVRGVLPLHGARFQLLADARERLLTPDAQHVALRDHLWAAPARHPAKARRGLQVVGSVLHGVDLGAVQPRLADGWTRISPRADDLIGPERQLGTLELAALVDSRFEGTASWTLPHDLAVDGFAVWFESELWGGERFTAKPGLEQTVHGCLYLPLRAPLQVRAGREFGLRFCGIPVDSDYTWAWECQFRDASGGLVALPRQSTVSTLVRTAARLRAMSEEHRPTLGLEGRRWKAALSLAESGLSSGEIAAALSGETSNRFRTPREAFDWLQRVVAALESSEAVRL